MDAPTGLFERVRFGTFELDVQTGELVSLQSATGAPQKTLLREQPFQILRILIDRPNKIVTRREIRQILWPTDTNVDFDRSINVAMASLRKALSDEAERPRYIETLARRGYRLIVPVEWQQSSSSAGPSRNSPDSKSAAERFTNAAALIGKLVARYRVLEILGGGGMGVVYKAEDVKLSRRVALKFLPDELAAEPKALSRFELEAKAASALNHPNICTIYGIEEFEGRPFIVMELLEGDTLSARLARVTEPLPLPVVLDIAIQVCDGLCAAHAKGIIHRDVKPANIFLTKPGPVKILDFGLAKLAATDEDRELPCADGESGPARTMDGVHAGLTLTGTTLGTAGYMSPEQIRKEKLDGRTDLFSFGLVLYEMSTGHRAFGGQSVAVVHEAILSAAPTAVRDLNPSVPRRLEEIISKVIEKDRERRYQFASEVRDDLVRIQAGSVPLHRTLRFAMVTLTVLAVMGLSAWAYWKVRNTITLLPSDTVVLADVENRTDDPALGDGLSLALQVALMQTPYLNILESHKLHETLRTLDLPADTKVSVSPAIARRVCDQTHSRAIIFSSITDIGNRYGIELKAINCETGTGLADTVNEAPTRGDIVRVLGLTAAQFRGKLGEPRESLARFNQPLDLATSSSPDALQFLAAAYQNHLKGELAEARKNYASAIGLDPDFGLAHTGSGSAALRGDIRDEEYTKAFQLRERLTVPSRFQVESLYYGQTLEAWDKSAQVNEEWVRTFPYDVVGRINFSAGLVCVGRPEEALVQAREAVRLFPSEPSFARVANAAMYSGRFDEAKAALDQEKTQPMRSIHTLRALVAFLQHDQPGMNAEWAWAENHLPQAYLVLFTRAKVEAFYGHFHNSRPWTEQAASNANKTGLRSEAAYIVTDGGLREVEVGNFEIGRHMTEMVAITADDYGSRAFAALTYARSGDVAKAQRGADTLLKDFSQNFSIREFAVPVIRAAISLQQKDPASAIEILRPVTKYELAQTYSFDNLYPAYIRGQAYLQLKRPDLAAAEFQKLLDHPGIVGACVTGALAHLQLARAQAMMDNYAEARKSYDDFLAMWKDADRDLPIYIQAKAEYAHLPKASLN